MKWITREHIKVDRVACPWLVQRFIDAQATFAFLPKATNWSAVTDGIVFDVPGCELGHHGEDVSFDSFLKKYNLTDPGLLLMAEIVRADDSHPMVPHWAGEGLRWIAHGFSALGHSDHELLNREFILYDALYAECKKRAAAETEDRVDLGSSDKTRITSVMMPAVAAQSLVTETEPLASSMQTERKQERLPWMGIRNPFSLRKLELAPS